MDVLRVDVVVDLGVAFVADWGCSWLVGWWVMDKTNIG